jgi:hypothetical protein
LLNGQWIVTIDYAPASNGLCAGVALCNVAKGNYWFIQTRGVAQVKFAAALIGSPGIGDTVTTDFVGASPYGYDFATGTPTWSQAKAIIGVAYGTPPVASTLSPVMLSGTKYYPGA